MAFAAGADRRARLGVFAALDALRVEGLDIFAAVAIRLGADPGFLRVTVLPRREIGFIRVFAIRLFITFFAGFGARLPFLKRFSIRRSSFSIFLRRFSSLFFLFSSFWLFFVDSTASSVTAHLIMPSRALRGVLRTDRSAGKHRVST